MTNLSKWLKKVPPFPVNVKRQLSLCIRKINQGGITMTVKFLLTGAFTTLIGLVSLNIQAASIWLEPVSQDTTIGGVATLELYADGEGIAFLAGGLDVFYDENIVSYNDDFAFDAAFDYDPAFSRTGDDCSADITALGCNVAGEINGIGFGNFNGIADTATLVGTLSFTGLSVGVSPVTMATNDLPAGDWYDVDSNLMEVAYNGAEVNVVPVPAAVWLFGTGLLGLIGVARRRK